MTTQSEVSRTIENAPVLKDSKKVNWLIVAVVTLILGLAFSLIMANLPGAESAGSNQSALSTITTRYQELTQRLAQLRPGSIEGPVAISIRPASSTASNPSALTVVSDRYQEMVEFLSGQGVTDLKAISIRPTGSAASSPPALTVVSDRYQAMAEFLSGQGMTDLKAISIRPVESVDASQSALSTISDRFQRLVDGFAQQGAGFGAGPVAISIRY